MPENTRRSFPVQGYQGKAQLHWGSDSGASDLFAPAGTPVVAMAGGTVVDVGASGPGGNNLTIRGDDGLTYYYAHLREAPSVKAGQRVTSGQRVGSVGETGNAAGTGAHLHIGIGQGIRSGTGPTGGSGIDHDAVGDLNGALGDQTVSMEGGGPGMATNQQGVSPSQRIFDQVVTAKGDPISVVPRDPRIDDPDIPGQKIDNPRPVFRYTFTDGTYIDVAHEARNQSGVAEGIEVRGGTALASTAKQTAPNPGTTVSTSTSEPYIVTRMPDGSLKREPNPNYVAPTGAKAGGPTTLNTDTGDQYIVRQNPDGSISREPNPNYVPPKTDKPARSTHTVGGRAFTLDENGNVLNSVDLRSPQQVQREGVDLRGAQQNLVKGDIDIAKARQDLLPKQQQILQGHQDTIKYVQGMLERGEIQQDQADAYIALSKQAAESALKGFTPFDEMKLKREAETANKRMGTDILTQRLSSGAGLASSLMSSAMGPNVMLRPGQQSLGVDPLASLMPIIEQLQGGSDITPFARSLLMGAQQPPGGAPQLPAGL